jgi:hypothetical protein
MTQEKSTPTYADPATINEFVNALQRLFKIGIYYPSGHEILDRATDRFMGLLIRLAGDNPSVTLADHKDSLMLEEIVVDSNLPFVQEFKTLLSTLGISALVFDRGITLEELHEFVRKMLFFRSKVLTTKQFMQVDVEDLPHSITIVSKEYLARKGGSISDELDSDAAQHLDSFIQSLSQYGLSQDEIGECKALLDTLPERLASKDLDVSSLPYATWDDVAKLLARSVKGGKQDKTDPRDTVSAFADIHALSTILSELEKYIKHRKTSDSINFLVSIIKKPVTDSDGKKTDNKLKKPTFPDKPDISIEEIQAFTTKNKPHPRILAQLPDIPADNETLTILLLMAQHEQPLQNQIRMMQFFRKVLSGQIQEKTWLIISGGLHNVILTGNDALIPLAVKFVCDPLRRSAYANSIHPLLLTVGLCNKAEFMKLWPYAVNEVLASGSSADPAAYRKLCENLARISEGEMIKVLPKMQDLDAFQEDKIAPDIFPELPPASYSLFAFLLKTKIGQFVGDRVIGGLRREPPDSVIKAVIHLLDFTVQEHKMFLYSYLVQAAQNELTPEIRASAAKIVTELLPALPQEKRAELWVRDSILALADLDTPETRALLEQIAREKKLLFISEWPTECRKAAEEALEG